MKRSDFRGPPKTPEEEKFRDDVRRLLRVPKSEIDKREAERPKRKRPNGGSKAG